MRLAPDDGVPPPAAAPTVMATGRACWGMLGADSAAAAVASAAAAAAVAARCSLTRATACASVMLGWRHTKSFSESWLANRTRPRCVIAACSFALNRCSRAPLDHTKYFFCKDSGRHTDTHRHSHTATHTWVKYGRGVTMSRLHD